MIYTACSGLELVEYLKVPIPILVVVYDNDSGSFGKDILNVVVPTPETA